MRDFIISDIHGCFDELKALLHKVRFQKETDRITFNGDLMDRGPDSYECFRFIMNLKKEMGDRCNLILGNHELMLLLSLEGRDRFAHWERNGCDATIESFRRNGASYTDAVEPIRQYFVPFVKIRGILVSHAGVVSKRPEYMTLEDLVWNRDAAYGRSLYQGCQVVGHTPSEKTYYVKRDPYSENTYYYNDIDTFLKTNIRCPIPEDVIFNIDGACVYGGSLVCMELIPASEESGRQSQSEQQLQSEQQPQSRQQLQSGQLDQPARYYRIQKVKSRQSRK